MTPKDDGKKETQLAIVECPCKKTKVAPGHFCPHCLWVHPDPESTPQDPPPPGAERVNKLKSALFDLGPELEVMEGWTVKNIYEIISDLQLRARQDKPLYSVDGESGKITRIDKPLDVEKVMGEIGKINWHDLNSKNMLCGLIRTILEEAMKGEKE